MSTGELLEVDPEPFGAYFDRRPFFVRTSLASHPLFTLAALAELAGRLPANYVEYNSGKLPIGARPELIPSNGLTPEETVRRIETCGSWMVLKRVEQVPEYAALLKGCLDSIQPLVERHAKRMLNRQAFVFVSSPGSVTPLHMDPEHNFLLQLRGTKTVRMWDPEDRFVVCEEDLETFHARFEHRNLPYREAFDASAYRLELSPGQGLHFPVTAPHWVQNGPEVSVSFSVTFRTEASQRRERAYRANGQLRRLGLKPSPVGKRPLIDGAKATAVGAVDLARSLLA